jgi:hypothetical protein
VKYRLRPDGHNGYVAEEEGLATARARAQLLAYSMLTGRTRPVDILDENNQLVETFRPQRTKEEQREIDREALGE